MKAKLTHFITIYQAGVEATFKLTAREYRYAMRNREHNFEWFAWADYEISRAKSARFNKLFDYNKGNFYVIEHGELTK